VDPIELAGQFDAIGLVPLLLWLHWSGEKARRIAQEKAEAQIDRLSLQWEAQIDQMITKYDERERDLRDRYDATITKIDAEKKEQADRVLEDIKALGLKVEDVIRFIARPVR